ncbi:MAG: universal stress protein, partial [Candidatus Bathyarchaeota archaeon]|nr:universal stress protein [Candidatus Bathyarchaeota archaeon]
MHTNDIRSKSDWYLGLCLFSKILVAVDGSDTADKALEFGFDVATRYSAALVVVSVFDVISTSL